MLYHPCKEHGAVGDDSLTAGIPLVSFSRLLSPASNTQNKVELPSTFQNKVVIPQSTPELNI